MRPALALTAAEEVETIRCVLVETVDEVKNFSWDERNLVFALTHAAEIRLVIELGADALHAELERWSPDERATLARTRAQVG